MVVKKSDVEARSAMRALRGGGIALAAMLLSGGSAQADETESSMFSLSGFGTLGIVQSNESRADFNHNSFQPNGAGFTHTWNPAVDSRLGVQVSANINDQLMAVVQLISEQQWDGSFKPIVEWANVNYAFTPDFSVRVGRIALPTMMLSESAKVAYASPWVRPPVEVYRQLAISNSDGIDATYRFRLGEIKHSVSAHYGVHKATVPDGSGGGSQWSARDFTGFADTMTSGAATLHVGYMRGRLLAWDLMAIPALAEIARQRLTVATVGVNYDPGNWFVMAEAVRKSLPLVGLQSSWYISAGPRIGKLTPFLTYAQQRQLKASIFTEPAAQKTIIAGVRWDLLENIDFKLQYERLKLGAGSPGNLIPRAGFQPGGTVAMISAAVDFVY